MTIPVSTVPGVKAYLYTSLKARAELAEPVLVSYDDPGPNQPDDIIVVGDVVRTVEMVQMVGSGAAGWLYERYAVTVLVECFISDDKPQTVFERAAALADVVVDVVRADPSLGGRVIESAPSMSEQIGSWDEEHGGRLSSLTVTVSVYARI